VPRDVAEPFAEPAGSIRSRVLDGRVARLVSRSRVLATNMGQSRTYLGSLKSDQDAEDDKCGRFATRTWNDLFNTRFAG
jgi:hypothetical protein